MRFAICVLIFWAMAAAVLLGSEVQAQSGARLVQLAHRVHVGAFVGQGLRCGVATGYGSMATAVAISCVPAPDHQGPIVPEEE